MTTEYALHSDPKACWVTADQVTGGAVRGVVYQKSTAKVALWSPYQKLQSQQSQTGGNNQWINRSFLCVMGLAA
jgi:hypothetical protein